MPLCYNDSVAIDHALESNFEPARSASWDHDLALSGPATGGTRSMSLCKLRLRPWSVLVVSVRADTTRCGRSQLAEYGSPHRRHPLELIDGLQLDLDGAAPIQRILKPKVPPPPRDPSRHRPRFSDR